MSQNTSSAVMQQRSEPHDSLDDFPTQPWATRALCEYVLTGCYLKNKTAWEPACNRGHMSVPLLEYFGAVWASDIHDYGTPGSFQHDFLFPVMPLSESPGWIISNPPFRLAEQFIAKARDLATEGAAMIVRTSFLEGIGRYENLFSKNPPSIVAQFSERVPMVKGRLTATGSTATSYCWLVWIKGVTSTKLVWIPPCRKKLERPEDYAAYRGEAA
ncbi:methyltransferase [Rhizobium leguminosarum]|uniref:methyltransferase n=1 Tax=Rhizobium leguminosarum TaxID=384 RepID=UPI00103063B1|nr:methyltransferase [Rhizobium leguminosarum]TAY66529.1 methyltransferase [Rhizobium leguminosarum]TBF35455.1 methyltransferase [Rhizobium leguminosarum]